MKSRLEHWKKEKSISIFIDDRDNSVIREYLNSINHKYILEKTEVDIIENAKELIFDFENQKPVIHVVSQSLCLKTFTLKQECILQFIFEPANDGEELFEEVKNIIAKALAVDIPIYPNTPELELELVKYYKNILENGFTAPGNDGERVQLIATNAKVIKDFQLENLQYIDTTKYWSALDIMMLKRNLQDEFLKLSNAQRTLNYLNVAVTKLSNSLSATKRNENELQLILSGNPILFGLDYSKIIPKHKLGAEYEIDYALEKFSGLIDVVEIESSSLRLFTKQGNPTKELVHAEQQIIDWLNWIEKNNHYANAKISGFTSPIGYVIIGRNSELTIRDKESLVRRNKLFNGAINILTYDDLLSKANTMLELLSKQ